LPAGIIVDQPGVLVLLAVLAPLAVVLAYTARRALRDLQALRRLASLPTAGASPEAVLRFKRGVDGVLTCVAVACVIVAAADVRWGSGWPAPAPRGGEVVLLVDLSRSMAVTDSAPSRLRQGLAAAADLVDALPAGTAGATATVAVVGFSDANHLLLPFTDDRHALRQQLAALHDQAPALGGSQLAAALHYASFALPGRPHAARTVVLVSDGESSFGDPAPVARQAGRAGVAVISVPVGTADGALVPAAAADGAAAGEHSARDERAMREIARLSGGRIADPLLPETMAAARAYLAGAADGAAASAATAGRPRYAVLALIALLALAGCAAVRAIRWRATF
jgi:hypothetical protein